LVFIYQLFMYWGASSLPKKLSLLSSYSTAFYFTDFFKE